MARLVQEKPAQMLQVIRTFVSFSRHCLQREQHQKQQEDKPQGTGPANNPAISTSADAVAPILPLFNPGAAPASPAGIPEGLSAELAAAMLSLFPVTAELNQMKPS